MSFGGWFWFYSRNSHALRCSVPYKGPLCKSPLFHTAFGSLLVFSFSSWQHAPIFGPVISGGNLINECTLASQCIRTQLFLTGMILLACSFDCQDRPVGEASCQWNRPAQGSDILPSNEPCMRFWSIGLGLGPGSPTSQLWDQSQVMLISLSLKWGNNSSSPHRVVGKNS